MNPDSPLTKFELWYKRPIKIFALIEHTGFALMTLALPMLERLCRKRSGIGYSLKLNDDFHLEVLKVFPELQDLHRAKLFWTFYRHGVLHQASFSLKRYDKEPFFGFVGFAHCPNEIVRPTISGRNTISFLLDPVAFAERVVETIERDVTEFIDAEPDRHPIADVSCKLNLADFKIEEDEDEQ